MIHETLCDGGHINSTVLFANRILLRYNERQIKDRYSVFLWHASSIALQPMQKKATHTMNVKVKKFVFAYSVGKVF